MNAALIGFVTLDVNATVGAILSNTVEIVFETALLFAAESCAELTGTLTATFPCAVGVTVNV